MLSVDYHLQAVLDLTEVAVQHVFGTSVVELCAPWRTLNASGVPAPTQILGQVLHGQGSIEAVRVPQFRRIAALSRADSKPTPFREASPCG